MNVRPRMYQYCYSNIGAIYAKGLLLLRNIQGQLYWSEE